VSSKNVGNSDLTVKIFCQIILDWKQENGESKISGTIDVLILLKLEMAFNAGNLIAKKQI
jgi:hypothetical protein